MANLILAPFSVLLWPIAGLLTWGAKALGLFVVIGALLLKANMRELPIWGNFNGIPPSYDTGFWKRWVWYAIRNGAHNLTFGDMPKFKSYGKIDEARRGVNVRWRQAGMLSSFRVAWGEPHREKGKNEFYIGFKLNDQPKVKMTFAQIRPAWLWLLLPLSIYLWRIM